METCIIARWQDWPGKGVEHTVVRCAPQSNGADGVVIGTADGHEFAARYQIRCDGSWRLQHATIELLGEHRKVVLRSDGHGKWTDASGIPLLRWTVRSIWTFQRAPLPTRYRSVVCN
jgi:hypothetical protein